MAIDTYARQLAMKALTQEAGITPTGTIDITENGAYDVTNYANANVNVSGGEDLSEYFKTSGLKQYTTNQFLWTQSVKKIPVLDISNLTELDFAFYYYKGEVPMLDTAHIVNFSSTFRYTTASTIPLWNTSKGTNFTYMFADSRIKDLPLIDTSSGEKFNYMFNRTTDLKTIPLLNTSKGITFNNMFEYSKIETIPLIDTSSGQSFERMFSSTSVLEIPKFNTSNGINFNYMFYSSQKITSIPQFDTSKGQTFVQMMYDCKSLKEIPELDFSSAIDIRTCIATSPVENLGGFKNLGKAYTKTTENNSNYTLNLSYSNLLTHDSLMNVINNLYDLNLTYDVANGGTLYTQKLQLGTTNMAKLTAEEIAIATNKGWTVV